MRRHGIMTAPTILIIDDEPDLLDLVEITLARMGLDVDRASTVASALERLAGGHYELCLTDMRLPDGNGLDIVRRIAQDWPRLPVAVITAFGSAENAVAALKAGAFDYLSKPVSLDQLRALVKTALKVPDPGAAPGELRLIGDSPAMCNIRALIDKLARSQAPVFISGASGTGKEVAARLIHTQGARAARPFVAVNCGALPETLMESEFFGYRKGAFTGANSDREGFFQAASGGTLFLDEVAELPMGMQVKLLRAIQERRVRRVGDVVEEPVDVRVISASHQDLARAVAEGRFRQDLFYRLNVIEMRMPPLNERREDIAPLARHFTARLGRENGAGVPEITEPALDALRAYSFPGNVRELENILERAFALGDGGVIGVDDLCLQPQASNPEISGDGSEMALQDYLDKVEREAIVKALETTQGNKTAAARKLGVTFRSLRYRIDRLGLDKD
jgi:two-component system response regulator PilR (NtrC family)